MSNCSSGCPTPGAHDSWGECVRAKDARVGWLGSGRDATAEKRHQRRIDYQRKLRAQGIKPDSTSLRDARRAEDISNKTGKPYISQR